MNDRIVKRLWKNAGFSAASAALVYFFFDNRSHCIDGRPAGTGYALWWAAHDPWFLLTLLLCCLAVGFAVTAALYGSVGQWEDVASEAEVVSRR